MKDIAVALQLLPLGWKSNPATDSVLLEKCKSENDKLPPLLWDYYEISNGGEGRVGNIYLTFWSADTLRDLNEEYAFQKYMHPNIIVIGTTDAAFIGFDGRTDKGHWCVFPFGDFDLNEVCEVCDDFPELIEAFVTAEFPAQARKLLT